MFFLLPVILLANASVVSHSTTSIEGEGTTYTKIQTTVNGNTTTVESNEPGSVSVEKTDTSESITSDNPVTVTHSSPEPTPTTITPVSATGSSTQKSPHTATANYWITLLRTLWDHLKKLIRFE